MQVYCKLCAKNPDKKLSSSSLKGKARLSAEKYISGSRFISKHTVQKHLNGKIHQSPQEFEKIATKTVSRPDSNVSSPKEDGSDLGPSRSQLQQPKTDVSLKKNK